MPSEKYTLTLPLPTGVTPADAIAALHSPLDVISLSPFAMQSDEIPSADPEVVLYNVRDKVTVLPFGLWDTSIEVPLEFRNFDKGVRIVKTVPPIGLTILEEWTVDEEKVTLEAGLIANWVVMMGAGGMMRGKHGVYVDSLGKLLQERVGAK
ncbi:hypothetical protein QBC35DRAFT_451760 [Podospora australis]|uniref:DUF7053 domain-containing protein n=1 Tax=Podospora australis TaxID=1536484 RepID=A0AAN6WTL7_9PEZI|nr:hypothetical protein QBC35DRAFT_451760 [Podospora australis]